MVKLEDLRERTEGMPFSIPLWQYDQELTCSASIDFIDITVANALMSVIKTWNNALYEVDTNPILKKMRPYSRYLPSLFKYGLLASGIYYTFGVVDKYFISSEPKTTAMFILIAYLFNFILWKFGLFTGRKAESHLDQLYEVSFISFSGADKSLAKRCVASKRNNTIYSACYFVSTFILGVLASVVANIIFQS